MKNISVTDISIYPIKSTRAYQVKQAYIDSEGLNFDRRFMFADENGKFISARKDGALFDFSGFPTQDGLQIFYKDGTHIFARYQSFKQIAPSEVWQSSFNSFVADDSVNQWISEKLDRTVTLRWLGKSSKRKIVQYPDMPLSFADSYPILLTNQQSLIKLQQHCPVSISMQHFRPNIVTDNIPAFSEQSWDKIRINNVEFLHTTPSTRCIMITRNPHSTHLDPDLEPFRTLKEINVNQKGNPLFGINLIPLNSGIIRYDDPIEILSYK